MVSAPIVAIATALLGLGSADAFVSRGAIAPVPSGGPRDRRRNRRIRSRREDAARARARARAPLSMALGDYSVELRKPLGMVLIERDGNGSNGVQVKELAEGGAASQTRIVPGDVLLAIDERDVSSLDFDSVMDALVGLDTDVSPARLTLGDGLGVLDMPKNVIKTLKSTDDAYLIDAVVRQAVREMRSDGKLGSVLRVEVIIGAGVREEDGAKVGQARFFAIFSTDGGVTSYSCNVSATGRRLPGEGGGVEIVALSAAKDEGLGQTYEFI